MELQVIAISDENTLVGKMAASAPLLLSLGDLWDDAILRAQRLYQCERVFAVKGNHDSNSTFPTGIEDLHLCIAEFRGVRFGGFKGCWQYKPRGHHLFMQFEVQEALRAFPAVDVFIAHNSPAGLHERDTDVHQGFEGFTEYIERTHPRYFFHGHQHTNNTTRLGETEVIGVYGEGLYTLEFAGLDGVTGAFSTFDFDD